MIRQLKLRCGRPDWKNIGSEILLFEFRDCLRMNNLSFGRNVFRDEFLALSENFAQ